MKWDVFICYATEDKGTFVEPLAVVLKDRGLRVWYDSFALTPGDHLRRSIDRGLSESRFGIVILSTAFFKSQWTQYELDGLIQREMGGHKVIIPVWLGVSRQEVFSHSPSLADRVAIPYTDVSKVVEQVIQVVAPQLSNRPCAVVTKDGQDATSFGRPRVFPDVNETELLLPPLANIIDPSVGTFVASPDNRRLAVIAARGEKVSAYVDGGYVDDGFDEFANHTLIFSPDSRRLAYAMVTGNRWWIIIDGVTSDESYDGIPQHGIVFSPSGGRVAYQALRGTDWIVVIDGIESRPYESTGAPFFSPDSKKAAFFGYRDDSCYLNVNGREVEKFDPSTVCEKTYEFTRDGGEVRAIENPPSPGYMVLDKEQTELDLIAHLAGIPKNRVTGSDQVPVIPGSIVRSPDNEREACYVQFGKGLSVVVDGKKGLVHEALFDSPPVFSPDSAHLAYFAQDYGKWRLVIDETPGDTAYEGFVMNTSPHFLNSDLVSFLILRDHRVCYAETKIKT